MAAERAPSRVRLLVLLLVAVLLASVAPVAAVPGPVRGPVAAVPALAAERVQGDDACGLLTDDEILRATGATGVISASPGSQALMTAGCYWRLDAVDPVYGPWELWVGVEPTGGRTRFEGELAFNENARLVAGIGDAAFVDFTGVWIAVTGDAALSVQYLGFGGAPRPNVVSARGLAWLLAKRLAGGGTAVEPTPVPGPSEAPVAEARRLVEAVRAEPFGPANVDAVVEILARSGIGTYADPMAPEPMRPVEGMASPMTLLIDQVRAMAVEAWAGGGVVGEDLDPLVPADADLADASSVLSGYVAAVETEGAAVARELMGEPDWAEPAAVLFPQLVLTLFVSDIAREQMAEAAAAGLADAGGAPRPRLGTLALLGGDILTAQGGLCTAASDFLNGALDRVFNALRLGASFGGPILVAVWSFVVGLAEKAFRDIIREITKPVLDLIGRVAAAAGMVATIVSAIRPWSLTVTAVPAVTAKGVGGSPGQAGQLVVRVDLGGFDEWPPYVEDCARVAGRTLPNLKPEGAPVTWDALIQAPDGLIAEGTRQGRLDADGVATWDFMTLVDEVADPWEDRTGQVRARVTVERPQLEDLRRIAIDELFGLLPSLVRGVLEPYLRPTVEQLAQKLALLISRSASGPATVIYHVPGATPEPGTTPEPTPRPAAVRVVRDRPALGDAVLAGRVIELLSCTGPYGPWSGVLRVGGLSLVPFADLPLAFSFRGVSGVQRTHATTGGRVPTSLPGVDFDVTFELDITVDGTTMTVSGSGTAGEVVQGAPLLDVGATIGPATRMPIEAATAGSC